MLHWRGKRGDDASKSACEEAADHCAATRQSGEHGVRQQLAKRTWCQECVLNVVQKIDPGHKYGFGYSVLIIITNAMHILITGAAGFIGQIVAEALISDSSHTLTLTDIKVPPIPQGNKVEEKITTLAADLCVSAALLASNNVDAAILLHGIMSSGAEADFDLGYRVNVDATRAIIDALAKAKPGVRIIYASSEAVYGRPVPRKGVTEDDIPAPEMSYGCQKIICETLINDYTRRGMINGFSLRFPTISIRPGVPSAAVSSFLSGVIREPLNGETCTIPLQNRSWKDWMCSPTTLVHNILIALELSRERLPMHRRSVNAPGFAVTVQEMLDALEEVGGKDKLQFVKEEKDPKLESVLYSWADDFDNSLALSLGMRQDTSFVDSVRDFVKTQART